MRSSYNELVELQLENHIKLVKMPATSFILKSSSMSDIIDSKSDSTINRVFQQIGFLGVQMSDKGKLYSSTLVGEMTSLFHRKYHFSSTYHTEEFSFVRSCLFHGLDPYQEIVHSISSRELMVRSSRGLTEPGTLFKNLMAIIQNVVCYDATVRNVCSHSVIQFEYGVKTRIMTHSLFAAGELVGVLAATAMSTPAYKAVLDSSPSNNSSWEMMKMENAMEPGRVTFDDKMVVRKAIEKAGIPFTYVSANCFAGYFLGGLCHPFGDLIPSTDSVVLLGDGNQKAIYVSEDDIATYTIKTIDDPRTLNKTLYLRPPQNILSQREVVQIWEKLIGKELNKSSISKEEFLATMKEQDYAMQVGLTHYYHVCYEGCLANFEIGAEGEEASNLYPEVKYTNVEEFLKRYI
ncbi:hypothetical protein LguiB_009544 [Lonicera macranthoides]